MYNPHQAAEQELNEFFGGKKHHRLAKRLHAAVKKAGGSVGGITQYSDESVFQYSRISADDVSEIIDDITNEECSSTGSAIDSCIVDLGKGDLLYVSNQWGKRPRWVSVKAEFDEDHENDDIFGDDDEDE